MSANIDRRTFLAGTTAGSLVLLSLGGCNKPDENKGAIKTSAGSDSGQAKPHYAMVFDQNKCIGCGLVQRSLQRNQQIAQGSFALSARTSDDSCSGNCVSDLRKTRRLRLRARIRSCLLSAVPGRPVRSCLPDRCSTSRPEDRYRDDGSGPLRRLQVLHCRLSLQRSIHQLGNKSGGQLRLLPEDQISKRRRTRLRTSLPARRLVFRRRQ